MNRKILTAFAAALLVGAATASVSSSNTVCRIVLETTTQDTLIGIPLVECTTNAASGPTAIINVTNFVMTAGLPQNTLLLYKNSSTWYSWQKTGAGTSDPWVSVAAVKDDKTFTSAAGDANFQRGRAVRLHLPSVPGSAQKIYLCGQYNADDVTGGATITAGASGSPVYSLVGNGQPKDCKISSLTWANIGTGDSILVPSASGQQEYIYDSAWKKRTWGTTTQTIPGLGSVSVATVNDVAVTDSDVIKAGQGFWYVSRHSGTQPTPVWPK